VVKKLSQRNRIVRIIVIGFVLLNVICDGFIIGELSSPSGRQQMFQRPSIYQSYGVAEPVHKNYAALKSESNYKLVATLDPQVESTESVQIEKNGEFIVFSDFQENIYFWKPPYEDKLFESIDKLEGQLLAFDQERNLIAVKNHSSIVVASIPDCKVITSLNNEFGTSVEASFSPDGSLIALFGMIDGKAVVSVVEIEKPDTELRRYNSVNRPISCVAISPDNEYLAIGQQGAYIQTESSAYSQMKNVINLIKIPNDKCPVTEIDVKDDVMELSFDVNSKKLYSAEMSSTLEIFDVKTLECLSAFNMIRIGTGASEGTTCWFSDDSTRLFATTFNQIDKTNFEEGIGVVDTSNGVIVDEFEIGNKSATGSDLHLKNFAMSNDNRWLAAGFTNGLIKVYRKKDGK
jgi:WD40 repeat protein